MFSANFRSLWYFVLITLFCNIVNADIMVHSNDFDKSSTKLFGRDEVKELPIVIAHRGASGYFPEHTVAAKVAGILLGADYLEQDIVITSDGHPVVLHDIHLDTVTNVKDVYPDRARSDGKYYVIDFTLAELRNLTAVERFDPKTGNRVFADRFMYNLAVSKIHTLEDELKLIDGANRTLGKQVGAYIEIKSPAFHLKEGKDISKIVLKVLKDFEKKHGWLGAPTYIQSFDWNETKRLRKELGYKGLLVQLYGENSWNEAPNVDYDYLKSAKGIEEVAKVADAIGVWISQVVKKGDNGDKIKLTGLAKKAHDAGLSVHVYTLRADQLPKWAATFEEVHKVLYGQVRVEGVFSDFPDISIVEQYN